MQELILFIAGAAIGGLLSWLISHRYYVKASRDQKEELTGLAQTLRAKTTLPDFEAMLASSSWSKAVVNHAEVWLADSDNTFQIVRGERSREFVERWTEVYPDGNSSAYPVHLKIGASVIKELTFISMDGGRIFVPMAELRPTSGGGVEYFWNVSSLEVRVCRFIGEYYIYKDLEGVSRMSKVTLVQ
jgi:hypothetical protein